MVDGEASAPFHSLDIATVEAPIALCTDAGMVLAARRWNHANVLCLSNRLLSEDLAREFLDAWFGEFPTEVGAAGVRELRGVEERWGTELAGSAHRSGG